MRLKSAGAGALKKAATLKRIDELIDLAREGLPVLRNRDIIREPGTRKPLYGMAYIKAIKEYDRTVERYPRVALQIGPTTCEVVFEKHRLLKIRANVSALPAGAF